MPPLTDDPSTKFIAPGIADGGAGPLHASGIDVVSTVSSNNLANVDTDWLPSSIVVGVDDLQLPWVVIAKVEHERIGGPSVGACACGFGPVQKSRSGCGLVGRKDSIAEA